MGLTHYWRRPQHLPPLTAVVADCHKILPIIGVPLATGWGTEVPAVFTDDEIMFNGVAPQRCETFAVRRVDRDRRGRPNLFAFTKTNRLPYDLCVRVVLIILRHHLGSSFQVMSDDRNWDHAKAVCQEHLGYGQDFCLDTERTRRAPVSYNEQTWRSSWGR